MPTIVSEGCCCADTGNCGCPPGTPQRCMYADIRTVSGSNCDCIQPMRVMLNPLGMGSSPFWPINWCLWSECIKCPDGSSLCITFGLGAPTGQDFNYGFQIEIITPDGESCTGDGSRGFSTIPFCNFCIGPFLVHLGGNICSCYDVHFDISFSLCGSECAGESGGGGGGGGIGGDLCTLNGGVWVNGVCVFGARPAAPGWLGGVI